MSGASGQVLPGPHCSALSVMRTVVRHLRTSQEGDLEEHGLLLAPKGNIADIPAFGEVLTRSLSQGLENPRYCSVSSFQEELCCPPGVEGGYLAALYHLYAPLLEGPVAQVPRHLPPGSCGGGSRPLARTYLPLTHD